jgi:hypothetical protein
MKTARRLEDGAPHDPSHHGPNRRVIFDRPLLDSRRHGDYVGDCRSPAGVSLAMAGSATASGAISIETRVSL